MLMKGLFQGIDDGSPMGRRVVGLLGRCFPIASLGKAGGAHEFAFLATTADHFVVETDILKRLDVADNLNAGRPISGMKRSGLEF